MSRKIARGSFFPDDISQWFWDIILKSGKKPDQLLSLLQSMNRDEIIRFDNEFQEAAVQLVDEPFLIFMDQGVSEDGAKDIADFVVSQGKDFYSHIWTHPEEIALQSPSKEEANCLSGVAAKHFWERFHERIPQFVDG